MRKHISIQEFLVSLSVSLPPPFLPTPFLSFQPGRLNTTVPGSNFRVTAAEGWHHELVQSGLSCHHKIQYYEAVRATNSENLLDQLELLSPLTHYHLRKAHLSIYTQTHACTRKRTHAHTHARTHAHTHTHTYTHTYTHTHTH